MISSWMQAISRGAADLVRGDVLAAVGDVLGDRAGEDERVLADVADQLADRLAADRLERHAAEPGPAAGRVRQPHQDAQPGRLAAPGPARHADRLAVADRHRDPVEAALDWPSAVRYSTCRSSATNSGLADARRGLAGSAGWNDRSVGPSASRAGRPPQAALVRLVDEPVDLVQRGHHVQEQHREGEDVAEADPPVDEQVDRRRRGRRGGRTPR